MKKWLIGICIILVILFLAGSYLFIPQNILISRTIISNCNDAGTFRLLSNQSNWQKWWPVNFTHINQTTVEEYKGYNFKLDKAQYNALTILLEKNHHSDSSVLHLFPLGADSTRIVWEASLKTGNNPFLKISRYFKAREIGDNLNEILAALESFVSDNKNIYGLDIKKEKVKVENLVSTTKVFSYYPETEAIYEMIGNAKKYISQQKAKEDDYPMLNIKALDDGRYEAQVAIPVDKELPSTDHFSLKRMLKNGDILAAEIRGGRSTCDSAMKMIALFAADHRFLNIALPFQSLVTDRTKEKDTSRWITKLFYPIVY